MNVPQKADRLALAKVISILGHPLVLGNVYVIAMSFHKMDTEAATWVSTLTFFLITLPIIGHNLYKMKVGKYENFDVSDQQQRKSFYPFALGLFTVLLILFLFLPVPSDVLVQTSVFFSMLVSMAVINQKVKASLHAAISFYIAVSVIQVHLVLSATLILLALSISWSRLITQRHSIQELIIGCISGVSFGIISLLVLYW